jgi:hypothetical protein
VWRRSAGLCETVSQEPEDGDNDTLTDAFAKESTWLFPGQHSAKTWLLCNKALQPPTSKDQHPVQHLTPNRADPPLRIGVRLGRPHRAPPTPPRMRCHTQHGAAAPVRQHRPGCPVDPRPGQRRRSTATSLRSVSSSVSLAAELRASSASHRLVLPPTTRPLPRPAVPRDRPARCGLVRRLREVADSIPWPDQPSQAPLWLGPDPDGRHRRRQDLVRTGVFAHNLVKVGGLPQAKQQRLAACG